MVDLKEGFYQFREALDRLGEAIESEKTSTDPDLIRDAVIKRFEFTYELCWKLLKLYMKYQGSPCFSPRDCFKKAFVSGLIKSDEEKVFLGMLEDRNLSTHTYDEVGCDEISEHIRNSYLFALRVFCDRFSKIMDQINKDEIKAN